jgi:tRNA threonylcarbamoyladenosine biosynthesis protein TsaE
MPDVQMVVTRSEVETEALARTLGQRAVAGTRIHLFGDLGSGKTVFVRGLADGLDADLNEVSSPTFTLVQEYRGRLSLYHADLYRVTPTEVPDLGLEALAADGVLAIEWAERLPDADPMAIQVRLEDLGGDERRITIASTSGAE